MTVTPCRGGSGRPRGSAGKTDLRVFNNLSTYGSLHFNEIVRRTRLSRASVSSTLKGFMEKRFIAKKVAGRKRIYELSNFPAAFFYVLKKNAGLVKQGKRLVRAADKTQKMIDTLSLSNDRVKASREFEEGDWSHRLSNHPTVAERIKAKYEEYLFPHPPSIMAFLYAIRKYPEIKELGFESPFEPPLGQLLKQVKVHRDTIKEKKRIGLRE